MKDLEIKVKFPLTKANLQNNADIMKQVIHNEKIQFLLETIKKQLDLISLNVLQKTYTTDIILTKNTDTTFKYDFEKELTINQYRGYDAFNVLNEVFNEKMIANNFKNTISYKCITKEDYEGVKMKIVEGLKERFPDSLIQIDPLKTYIYINWT